MGGGFRTAIQFLDANLLTSSNRARARFVFPAEPGLLVRKKYKSAADIRLG
jgi:hypothetical protein